jgi:hypothetical protein
MNTQCGPTMGAAGSDREERLKRASGNLDLDRIARRHNSAGYHHRFADRTALSIRAGDLLSRPGSNPSICRQGLRSPVT